MPTYFGIAWYLINLLSKSHRVLSIRGDAEQKWDNTGQHRPCVLITDIVHCSWGKSTGIGSQHHLYAN